MNHAKALDHLDPDDHPEAELFSRVAREMMEPKSWTNPPSEWIRRPAPQAVSGEIDGK